MTGYSLHSRIIKWKCSCKKHENGHCTTTSTQKEELVLESFDGGFGFRVKTNGQAKKKFETMQAAGSFSVQ